MKIVLISPCDKRNEWKDTRSVFVFPPLSLACLKAVTPARHSVVTIDETIEPIDIPQDVDLIGISIFTSSATRGYELADEFRATSIPVVLGGIHVTLCPDEASLHADAIVTGEGEDAWPRLLEDFENGQLQPRYSTGPVDLSQTGIPDHSIYSKSRYRISQTVMATRGCPFQCSFCATTYLFGKRFRTRPLDQIVTEISSFRKRLFLFLDDNLFFNRHYAKDLMRALIPLKKNWVAQADFTISEDEELLRLARKAGCMALLLGFETVSGENFHELGKPVKKLDDYRKAIQNIHKAGMMIQGSFIFGFDGDTKSIFQDTLNFVKALHIDTANFCVLTPLPGTPVFQKLNDEGRILTKDWSTYTRQNVVFQPKNFSPEELTKGRFYVYQKFYSLPSMFRRMPFRLPQFFLYWLYNISFRIGINRTMRSSAGAMSSESQS